MRAVCEREPREGGRRAPGVLHERGRRLEIDPPPWNNMSGRRSTSGERPISVISATGCSCAAAGVQAHELGGVVASLAGRTSGVFRAP